MMKSAQISILARIYGNVNADETIGNRITIKKFYSSEGEILPFVSARAIKYAIRKALELENKEFEIDPLVAEKTEMQDSGNPIKYVDNDLFGFMAPYKGERRGEGGSITRQAPIAISYFKALRNTPVNVEFGARFPRESTVKANNRNPEDLNPVPFEIEVADFIGKLNVLIYDYVGKFKESELVKVSESEKLRLQKKGEYYELSREKREQRLKAFLTILLTPKYVLPRRTNSLNIPEYKFAVIVLNEEGVLPIYQYLDYIEDGKVDTEKLMRLKEICEETRSEMFVIDYENWLGEDIKVEKISVKSAIEKIIRHLL